jgi:hypothetical protein
MKKQRYFWSLLVIVITIFNAHYVLYAQNSTKGCIYLSYGDTLCVDLEEGQNFTANNWVYYKETGVKKTQRLFKDDIKAIKIGQDSFVYEKVHYKYAAGYDTKVYKVELDGELKLYSKRIDRVQVLSPGGHLSGQGGFYLEYYIKKNKEIVRITKRNFKKKMLNFVVSCPSVYQKVLKNELQFEHKEDMVKEFNTCIKP